MVLTLGGSIVGIVVGLVVLFAAPIEVASLLLMAFLLAVFGVGVLIGVWLWRRDPRGTKWAVPFWALQIPLVSSSAFSYQFATGAFLFLVLTGDGRLQLNGQLGSALNVYLNSPAPVAIGVNVVAIVMTVLLWRRRASL
jgi:hypothetical protein